MRRLDRSRPFGTCTGTDGIAFNQDGLPFDRDGNEIVEGKAEPVYGAGGLSADALEAIANAGGGGVKALRDGWRDLPWPDLKKLGAKFKAPANLKRPDLIDFIEAGQAEKVLASID